MAERSRQMKRLLMISMGETEAERVERGHRFALLLRKTCKLTRPHNPHKPPLECECTRQREAAFLLGVNQATISHMCTGQVAVPAVTVDAFERAFGKKALNRLLEPCKFGKSQGVQPTRFDKHRNMYED